MLGTGAVEGLESESRSRATLSVETRRVEGLTKHGRRGTRGGEGPLVATAANQRDARDWQDGEVGRHQPG